VRKILLISGLALGWVLATFAADLNLSLTDGSTLAGEVTKHDDNGLQLHSGDTYTNIAWGRLTQDSLKQLAGDPKIRPLVEPFIEPEASQHAPKTEIKIHPVQRLELPANPSLFGGLVSSPVGKFILFILFLANLFAAYEVAIVKARPPLPVIGVSALLPIIGPVMFLAMKMKAVTATETHAEHAAPAGTQAASAQAQAANPEIEIGEASWKKPEEKKIEAQVFTRGKFTFNKKFVETKFAGFVGTEPKGDALKFWMEVKSPAVHIGAAYIESVGMTEAVFMTDNGQVTVPLADIQEIKLNPRPA
jgi:hypothetical protein